MFEENNAVISLYGIKMFSLCLLIMKQLFWILYLKVYALSDIYIGATNIINNAWNDHVFWVCACLLCVSVMQILEWITDEYTHIH